MLIHCYMCAHLIRAILTLGNYVPAGNILILRGDIEVQPSDRRSISYEHLAQLLAEYLLRSCPDVDISSALTTMPVTRSASYLHRPIS